VFADFQGDESARSAALTQLKAIFNKHRRDIINSSSDLERYIGDEIKKVRPEYT
jgi:hypothetical protein